MGREIEADEVEGTQEQPPLETVGDLFQALTWQEGQTLEQRLRNVRGMARYLRSRSNRRHRAAARLLKVLRGLDRWGTALLGSSDGESVPEEINWAVERSLFEDTLCAATEEFFGLVDQLDEP